MSVRFLYFLGPSLEFDEGEVIDDDAWDDGASEVGGVASTS